MTVRDHGHGAAARSAVSLSLRGRDRILSIASPIGLLLVWEIAARVGLIDTRFFPAPSSILSLLFEMLKSGELLIAHRRPACSDCSGAS